jgi:hypothetical protein
VQVCDADEAPLEKGQKGIEQISQHGNSFSGVEAGGQSARGRTFEQKDAIYERIRREP